MTIREADLLFAALLLNGVLSAVKQHPSSSTQQHACSTILQCCNTAKVQGSLLITHLA
jgi:hypothetical protein